MIVRQYGRSLRESEEKQSLVTSIACGACDHKVDFTNIIAKEVLISVLADEEVKRDVLGCRDLDTKTADEIVMFIEAKEMVQLKMESHTRPR